MPSSRVRETSRSRQCFDLYVSLGPQRSLEQVHQKYPNSTPSVRQLKKWSALYGWVAQAHTHDEEQRRLERERRDAEDREQADLRRKHRLGVAVMERSLAVAALQLKAQQDRISAYAAVQLLQHADACERLDYGEVTSRTAIHGSANEPIRFTIAIDHGGREHPSESPGASGWGAVVGKPDGLERNPT